MRAIVVDDEKLSREVLCNYLEEYCPDVEVVAKATSVKTACSTIKKFSPDIVFLDIEMADGKGFDLLSMFEKIDFKVIFVTAYSNYAIKAFRYSAVDYLLKPIKVDELIESVNKAKNSSNLSSEAGLVEVLLQNLKEGQTQNNTLIIHHNRGFDVLKLPEIIMCQADGYCTIFFLTGQRKVMSSKNLKNYEELLDRNFFIRVHHSYLVNINHISGYTRQGDINLSEDLKACLGDSYKSEFLRIMQGSGKSTRKPRSGH